MTSATPSIKDPGFEKAISYVLISGVTISLILEIIGIILFSASYGNLSISERKDVFIRGHDFFAFLAELFRGGNRQKDGILIMALGITTLILTPYVRVIMSVLHFAREKNIKYVLITLFVLILLTLSLAH
jgi:uncharacterized membrane protein